MLRARSAVTALKAIGLEIVEAGDNTTPAFRLSNAMGLYSSTVRLVSGTTLAAIGFGTVLAHASGNQGMGPLRLSSNGNLVWGEVDSNGDQRIWAGSNPINVITVANSSGTGQNGVISYIAYNPAATNGGATEPAILWHKSRGTPGVLAAVQFGDSLGQLQWAGDDGVSGLNDYQRCLAASYNVTVATGGVTSDGFGTNVPASHGFYVVPIAGYHPTNANLRGNAALTKLLTLDGNMTINGFAETFQNFGTLFRLVSGYSSRATGMVTARFENGATGGPTNVDIATINFTGYNDTPAVRNYGQIYTRGSNTSNGTEQSEMWLGTYQAGTFTYNLKIGGAGGITVGAPSGSFKGAGTANFAGDIYKNGAKFTASGGFDITFAATATTVATLPSGTSTLVGTSSGITYIQNQGNSAVYIRNTSSPGATGTVGSLNFRSLNDAAAYKDFASWTGTASAIGAGAEDGRLILQMLENGATITEILVGGSGTPGVSIGNVSPTGSETLNVKSGIYLNSSLIVNSSGTVTTLASSTSRAGLRIAHGTAPTSPVDGDMWTTSAGGLFVRINGVTKTVTLT